MRAPLARWARAARRPPPASELALAAVVAVVMSADTGIAAWPVPALLLALVSGLSLAWRLRWPFLPLALTSGVNVLLEATAHGEYGPQTVALGVMVATYSAAAHLAGRRALLAGVLSLAAEWAAHVSTGEGDAGDFFPFVVWAAPWIAGRLVRRQTIEAREAGARAALLEVEAREAASLERDRIARELHDVVGHAVSVMVIQAGAARLTQRGDPATLSALEAIEKSGRQALVELRAMLGVLRSTDAVDERSPQPTLASLPALVEQVRRAGLPVTLSTSDGPFGGPAVPAGVGLTVYRIVQESLTNALRHAGAVETAVRVEIGAEVQVRVSNALPGRAEGGTEGRGLLGMRERVTLHGGTLSAGPCDGRWVVDARLPLLGALGALG